MVLNIPYANQCNSKKHSYTADGARNYKKVNGATTFFYWNGSNLAAEENGSNINKYYYGIDGIAFANLNGTDNFYLKNIHGDIVGSVNTSGEIINNTNYDAFGNRLSAAPAPFGYCGEYMDIETGLIYLRNRYYDTTTGAFISEDPIKDGLNWYGYCGGNPVMFVDPFGLSPGTSDISIPAQLYIQYYNNFAFEADNKTLKNKYELLINDIINADNKNMVVGNSLDVPLYNQGESYMCYAYDEIMVSQTGKKYKYTQKLADSVAEAWGRWKYRNLADKLQYKDGGSPSVTKKFLTEPEIIESLNQYPVYAFGNGHVWVITGYAQAPGHNTIFTINDSEGPSTHTMTFKEMNNLGYNVFMPPSQSRIDQILTSSDYNLFDLGKLFTGVGTIQIKIGGQIAEEFQGVQY